MNEQIHVEVVYTSNARQKVVPLKLSAGATVREAIERSGLLVEFQDIDLAKNKIGVWNKPSKPEAVLRDYDRVEIYRPLIADPKEVRRQRAAEGKVMKKGGGDASAE